MALSSEERRVLGIALADETIASSIADQIDSGGNPVAANVAALGATSDLTTISGTYGIPAEPTGAEVDATVQALADEVEARLDAAEAKIDAVIAALVASGQMASS